MPRPKEFNREEALTKAMEVFWCKGYEAASMADLLKAMGINRGSFYDTFSDKATLFQEALRLYRRRIEESIAPLKAPAAGRKEVESFFADGLKRWASCDCTQGCFLANSMVERANCCSKTARQVNDCCAEVEDALTNALSNAKKRGEIQVEFTPRALARGLLVNIIGLNALSKCCSEPAKIRGAVKVALAALG